MAPTILKTKLFIPPASTRIIARPRLLQHLDQLAEQGRLVGLILAPAGSGKTTLVVQWLHQLGWPVSWVSLDADDNLPLRFFSYVTAAISDSLPSSGRESFENVTKEALALLALPGAEMAEVITLLVNGLTDVLPEEGLVLVLDDFHTITNPRLHQALDLFLDAQPPHLRLVIISREDPAMKLARRRSSGQLVEVRQGDLSFTIDEAFEYLNQAMDLNLNPGQVEMLAQRTEGWIAGLQMASLALRSPLANQQGVDLEGFLAQFSGSHRYILDYLVEEVLARQPAELQEFLYQTAILERMEADLCAAITRITTQEARNLLAQIAKANLFVIPLDEERRWYRYHHLFRDLLLSRLEMGNPGLKAGLERRASDWFDANGDARAAVEYAIRSHDLHHAAGLIERHIIERWQTVDFEFHLLINRLPFDVVAEHPALCLQNAWLCVLLGQTNRIIPFVEAAESALLKSSDPIEVGGRSSREESLAFAYALRAYVADLKNQPVRLDDSLVLAYSAIPEANVGMRNSVGVVIGTIYHMEADFQTALWYFEQALALDKQVNGTNAVPVSTMRITFVLQVLGRLREAMRRLREADSYVRERGIRRFYIAGVLPLCMANIYLEWNQPEEAAGLIAEGARLLEDWPVPSTKALQIPLLVWLQIFQGNLPGAREVIAQADTLQQQTELHPIFLEGIERARLQLYLAEGNKAAIEEWARKNEFTLQQPAGFRYEDRQIELARAWLALGRYDQARKLLERLADAAQERVGRRIRILTLLAAAQLDQTEKALQALDEALQLGEPEGYILTFTEVGDRLRQVLDGWIERKSSNANPRLREYAREVRSAFNPKRPVPVSRGNHTLVEPLSPRELEVLGLIARGLTNQQIASRLIISVRTVKKHVENIHSKLNVENRTQAVIRAQEIGLLKPVDEN